MAAPSSANAQRIASLAAHDLQEPLQLVSGYLDLLVAHHEGRLQIDAAKVAHEARDAAVRMSAMLRSMLDYGRLGGDAARRAPVAMGDTLEDALVVLGPAIQVAGATVTSDALPIVTGDRVLLARVFQNLLSNAVKFRPKERPPRIHVSATKTHQGWRFDVHDNGVGLPPEARGAMFEPFRRFHGQAFSGTGLGLAGCKHIIEAHGGRIWAEANDGPGTTFSFTIPETIP